ncbi:MAG TPA: redoxin domain-containing protein [Hyphomicrobiaceae bacterium]|nr:redoxin domain-containing protein [Hyphomicrobiaceae bacterium]
MTSSPLRDPVAPGEQAPEFTLPSADGAGTISLTDYRGNAPVFLGILVGLWCPFCRRAIAQMAANVSKLKAIGVETVGVVATPPENAKLYFKFRPSRLRLGADPALATHRAYGIPRPAPTPEFLHALETIRINPEGALPQALPISEAAAAVGKLDGYENNETDRADMERQWPQLKGQFLIDRGGVVRWASIEGAEGPAAIGKFPPAEEIIAAARNL